jgi:hypothetical protein
MSSDAVIKRNGNSDFGVFLEVLTLFVSVRVFLLFFCGVQKPAVGADMLLYKARCMYTVIRVDTESWISRVHVPMIISFGQLRKAVFLDFRK